jgi:hypothetical protein
LGKNAGSEARFVVVLTKLELITAGPKSSRHVKVLEVPSATAMLLATRHEVHTPDA